MLELSNDVDAIKQVGKLEYQKKKLVGMSSYGLVIKLADRLHNVSDFPTNKMITDTIELIEFLTKVRKLSISQTQICQRILEISVSKN